MPLSNAAPAPNVRYGYDRHSFEPREIAAPFPKREYALQNDENRLLSTTALPPQSYASIGPDEHWPAIPVDASSSSENDGAKRRPFLTTVASIVAFWMLPEISHSSAWEPMGLLIPRMTASSASRCANFGSADVSNYSFAELAASMVPAYYESLSPQLGLVTKWVMPEDVYNVRKMMLKTRDLIDVFSPVYPNTTLDTGLDDDEDLWLCIRYHLDKGYTAVGNFQDLYHAHVQYTERQLNDLRDEILNWKHDFDIFIQNHNLSSFLAATSTKSFSHRKESRLFWKHTVHAHGADSATASLQTLGAYQLRLSLVYLELAYPYKSIIECEHAHKCMHHLRKELRSLKDEFGLFGSIMFPNSSETDSAFAMITTARDLLGDINDDWTAYTIYKQKKKHHAKQKKLRKSINEAWIKFKRWSVKSNLKGTLHCLASSLDGM